MTVKEGTICNLIQSFPVFLILAQNAQKCLKTPLVYKPPSPTRSPEYYEALDALFQSLYGHGLSGHGVSGHGISGHGISGPGISGHGISGHHGNEHGYHGYQDPGITACQYSYGYARKWSNSHGGSYGGAKPCYQYVYTTGNNYHTYGSGLQGYPSYGSYGLKKGNIYSLSNISSSGYAPSQVYNTKNRYQVVVKKTKIGGGRKKNGKIQGGFFPQRENRNGGLFGQGLLQGSKRLQDRLSGLFNKQQRPIFSPQNPGMSPPNQYDQQNYGRPVAFPTNNPVNYDNGQNNGNINFQPNPDYNFQPDQGNNFQPDQGNANFQPNYGNGDTNTYENQPANQGAGNDETSQDNNNIKPNEADTGVQADNDAVNFNDSPPKVPQETTTLPTLTPVPETESRNNFNFQTPGPELFTETCQTVDGGVGSCISVHQCQPYLKIIQESRTNPNAVQILRRAHCGFEGTTPKVCCPRPGLPVTPPPFMTTAAPTPAPTPAPTQAPTAPPPTAAAKTSLGDFVSALPEPPVCGVSNATFSRVVGGIDAKLGDFPWMALLGYMSKRTGATNWLCGGSLVSSRHVLTAAHCIHNHENDLYVVRLGELDLAREDDGATPVDILIKTKIKHEQYSPTAFTNDIGILVLENEATFTDLIRPICIPKETELRARSFEDYNPMIAGWGHTEFRGPSATHLQVLQLPVVSNEYCTQAYSAYKSQTIDGRVLCAGFKQGGKDACQGDSGGPLMQPIYNQETYKTYFYQIGVVSYGKKCAEANFPGVYSRVTHFVPWIEEKVIGYSSK